MKETIKNVLILLTVFSCILLFGVSLNCVVDTLKIQWDLLHGKSVEYQRFILDILGCILMCYYANDIANDE